MFAEHDDRLIADVSKFVDELTGTIEGSLDCDVEESEAYATSGKQNEHLVGYDLAVVAKVGSQSTYRFEAKFLMTWNTTKTFLAVENSEFTLYLASSNEPLFHYDYLRNVNGWIPGAHINIHHDRDDLREARRRAGKKKRGKRVQKRVESGEAISDSELHYPVGGPRFRPAVEDVIQFMIYELGVDTKPDWQARLNEGRREWRERQLRAAVTDNLHIAVDELRLKGFTVTGGPDADPNLRRLYEL